MERTIKIEVGAEGLYYMAVLYNENEQNSHTYGIGTNPKEAIGSLIIGHPKDFNLIVQGLTSKTQYE